MTDTTTYLPHRVMRNGEPVQLREILRTSGSMPCTEAHNPDTDSQDEWASVCIDFSDRCPECHAPIVRLDHRNESRFVTRRHPWGCSNPTPLDTVMALA